MKKIILLSCVVLFLSSCKDKKKSGTEDTGAGMAQKEIHKDLYGSWVGDFIIAGSDEYEGDMNSANDKLNIIIKSITENEVTGQSIVSGNVRPLTGKIAKNGDQISFILDEPGTEKYDGRFEFKLKGDTLIGLWNAYKTELKWPAKSYKLLRKSFVYNPNLMLSADYGYVDWSSEKVKSELDTLEDGTIDTVSVNAFYRSASDKVFKLNASNTTLKEKDLKNLRKLDLQILRNTIFARHGFTFKKQTYKDFFNPIEWYIPVSDNVDKELTGLERQNIKILLRFEKYAEDNYDTFGR
jgi:hypothetical protein